MIYYDIQHFGDSRWITWLLQRLQHPSNSFRISYDAGAELVNRVAIELQRQNIEARQLSVERSMPIRWCGPSQVEGLMHALRRAVACDGWEFFVNLSGTCFPLHRQERLFSYLKNSLDQGHSSHFHWFRLRKPVTLPEEDPGAPQVRARLGRLHLEGNARLIEMFRDPDYFPVVRPSNRLLLKCVEPEDVPDLLKVSCLDPEELSFRQAYLAHFPHYCGRAWFILHRSDCEELVSFFNSPDFKDSARFFLSAFEPDESFLQTLIMNRVVLSPERVGPDSLRTFGGAPRLLNDSNLQLLDGQERAFFGRKIQHSKARELRKLIEARTA